MTDSKTVERIRTRLGVLFVPVTVALVSLLAACGTSRSSSAMPEGTDVPAPTPLTSGRPAPPTTELGVPVPVDLALVDVYLVRDDVLTKVSREVEWDDLVTNSVEALLAGPSEAEIRNGFDTALDPAIEVHDLTFADGIAHLDLSRDFGVANGTEHMLTRLGQTVYTLTEFPEIRAVRFALDGRPVTELPDEGIDCAAR